ncbi:MAG: zinc-ribbon domain-containing protein [Deltaproteobacteria bacterium]|nr:zinc-ribbon domain-containing protein [Deltaproteobacteria bacterium]
MESERIVCIQCENEFEFSIADQIRYAEKGFEPPRRCPACRRNKSKIIYLDGKREAKNRRVPHRNRKESEY